MCRGQTKDSLGQNLSLQLAVSAEHARTKMRDDLPLHVGLCEHLVRNFISIDNLRSKLF